MNFDGRVAFVTGGASGIGRATAISFARQGARLAVIDIDGAGAAQTRALIHELGGECLVFEGSVASRNDVQKSIDETAKKFGKLDFVFNNAGCEFIAPLLETSDEQWDDVIDTNLKGTFMVAQEAVAHMVRTGFGVIVNNASDAGLRGIKLNAAYSTSKAGIIHLTRSIALDYAPKGIRCNCICPGCIDTPLCRRFNEEVGARKGQTGRQSLDEFVAENIPMQRVGEPEEVASVVLFLCSEEARYVTGAVIPIDGGLTAGM